MIGQKNMGILLGVMLSACLLASSVTAAAMTGLNNRTQFQLLGSVCQGILKENPDIVFNKNIREVTDATLVYSGNAQQVLDRVYAYYQRAENVVGDVLIGNKKLGQKVRIDTDYDGYRTGIIESYNYSFSPNEIKAEVKIHE